jgi:hypothetical protein
MTLLDRFRAPSHKHADPAVRLARVAEIPLDDRETIAAVAREDEDPRVRKAAVAKLLDPVALGAIARDDQDEGVRAAAAGMLVDLALEAFEGVTAAESLTAVDELVQGRHLVQVGQVAKTSSVEDVAVRAVAAVTDGHALGSIARHASVEAARLLALHQLVERAEHAEVLAVALNSEFKDTALAALTQISDRGELEQIDARGKNKSAAKRARAVLREQDEEAAREAEALAAAREAETLAAGAAAARAESDRVTAAAAEAHAAAVPVDAPADTPVETEAEAAARAETEARQQAEAAEAARRDLERRHARLAELAEAASAALGAPDLATARKAIDVVRREWDALARGLEVDPTLAARLTDVEAVIASRHQEAEEAEQRARREALARMKNLVSRVEPLVARTDLTTKAAERALRDLRAALGSMPTLPTRQDADDITSRLKAAQAALVPRAQELREAEDWQRWANVTIQEQLCARMEALAAVEDAEQIAKDVRELQQQWRQAAEVPRAKADQLWRRFKAAHDVVWPRCEAHFAAEAVARVENLAHKVTLCEQVEALAESTAWIQTAEKIKELQAEWKTIGAVSRGKEKAIWERFRAACDRFFTRRHEDLADRKKVWSENLAKKEALIAAAEALADSTDWDQAAAAVRQLQAEWKTVGPVRKNRSDAVWQRFHGACDRFFARFAQRHEVAQAERVAAREAICSEFEALAAIDTAEPPADLVATVRSLRSRWQQELAARGVDPDRAAALEARVTAASAVVTSRWAAAFAGTDLDPDANRKRAEAIIVKIEELATSLTTTRPGVDPSAAPASQLAAMLKEALAANTIGGKADGESKWRAALEEIRQAQASLGRVGTLPDDVRRDLGGRFTRACRTITDHAAKAGVTESPAGFGGPGAGRSDRGGPSRRGGPGPRRDGGSGRPGRPR